MDTPSEPERDLALLEHIEVDPDVTQASLATRLGVAVGTVNWHIRRLISKGYLKVRRAERRKLRYLITPEGLAFRAHLTVDYIEQSLLLYRNTRQRVITLLAEARRQGFERVRLAGEQAGDLVDICRLTCLEQNMLVCTDLAAPALFIQGMRVSLCPPGELPVGESPPPPSPSPSIS